MSTKQYVGLATPGAAEPAIYSIDGAIWRCDAEAHVDIEELSRHSSAGTCLAALPGAHIASVPETKNQSPNPGIRANNTLHK